MLIFLGISSLAKVARHGTRFPGKSFSAAFFWLNYLHLTFIAAAKSSSKFGEPILSRADTEGSEPQAVSHAKKSRGKSPKRSPKPAIPAPSVSREDSEKDEHIDVSLDDDILIEDDVPLAATSPREPHRIVPATPELPGNVPPTLAAAPAATDESNSPAVATCYVCKCSIEEMDLQVRI